MMKTDPYQSCLAKMFRLRRFGIKLGLELIGTILDRLGNPHQKYDTIHIAGTNGKGSVAAYLSTILRCAGYRVGRYTSPHLERFNERICVNDRPITDSEVVESYRRVEKVDGLDREPTFFEFATAMALETFARHNVQWAVIETGMGGRLDATNILHPKLGIITNISLEHKDYLGTTLAQIAREKAGIIKPGMPTVCGARQPVARKVITARAMEVGAPLYFLGRHYRVRRQPGGETFNYHGPHHDWTGLRTSLVGRHQVENAAHALAACDLLTSQGALDLTADAVARGLKEASWPGRLEIVMHRPLVILDGAHNLAAARNLARHLKSNYQNRNITMVVGILDDKPFKAILKQLAGCCRKIIFTRPEIGRALPAENLYKAASQYDIQKEIRTPVAAAVGHAVGSADPDELICIAGSLYVVGEAKTALAGLLTTQPSKMANGT